MFSAVSPVGPEAGGANIIHLDKVHAPGGIKGQQGIIVGDGDPCGGRETGEIVLVIGGAAEEHLETIIEIPRSLAGVEVAFTVRQPEEKNVFRVSMRSNGDFDVSEVCAIFGGGGHAKAAGCTIEAGGVYDAEKMILSEVQKLL